MLFNPTPHPWIPDDVLPRTPSHEWAHSTSKSLAIPSPRRSTPVTPATPAPPGAFPLDNPVQYAPIHVFDTSFLTQHTNPTQDQGLTPSNLSTKTLNGSPVTGRSLYSLHSTDDPEEYTETPAMKQQQGVGYDRAPVHPDSGPSDPSATEAFPADGYPNPDSDSESASDLEEPSQLHLAPPVVNTQPRTHPLAGPDARLPSDEGYQLLQDTDELYGNENDVKPAGTEMIKEDVHSDRDLKMRRFVDDGITVEDVEPQMHTSQPQPLAREPRLLADRAPAPLEVEPDINKGTTKVVLDDGAIPPANDNRATDAPRRARATSTIETTAPTSKSASTAPTTGQEVRARRAMSDASRFQAGGPILPVSKPIPIAASAAAPGPSSHQKPAGESVNADTTPPAPQSEDQPPSPTTAKRTSTLIDRLKGEVKVISGKLKRDEAKVEEGRRLISMGKDRGKGKARDV